MKILLTICSLIVLSHCQYIDYGYNYGTTSRYDDTDYHQGSPRPYHYGTTSRYDDTDYYQGSPRPPGPPGPYDDPSDPTGPPREALQRLVGQLTSRCFKNNAPQDVFPVAMVKATECLESVISNAELYQLQNKFQRILFSGLKFSDVLEPICKKRSIAFSCIHDFVEAFLPCFPEDEERESLNILRKQIKRIVAFVCYENGSYLETFFKKGGMECFKTQEVDLQFCTLPILSRHDLKTVSLDDINNWFDTETCSSSQDFISCLQNTLDCPEPAEAVITLLTQLLNETSCNE